MRVTAQNEWVSDVLGFFLDLLDRRHADDAVIGHPF
jgi:hypothetical protein